MRTTNNHHWKSFSMRHWFELLDLSRPVISMMFAALALLLVHKAHAVTLYDGALHSLPEAQGWMYGELPPGMVSRGVAGGITSLDTTAFGPTMAGYFSSVPFVGRHPDQPVLNRFQGFTVSFTVQLLAETHSSADRAGFSVIVTGHDFFGLELGFWTDEIWAQNATPLFTHGEGVGFDTTRGLIEYTVAVQGSSYTLLADGASILRGALRDYRASVGPLSFPYHTSNMLFFGDDTSSASAAVHVAAITATPEPGTVWLVASSLGILAITQRRQWRSWFSK